MRGRDRTPRCARSAADPAAGGPGLDTASWQRMLEMRDPTTSRSPRPVPVCRRGPHRRWSGRGVQVQNLPRVPKGFSPDLFYEMACAAPQRGRWCVECGGPSSGAGLRVVVSAVLPEGDGRYAASCGSSTSSQIEARVLAWLAGQQDVLDVFASGDDVYVWAAGQFGSSRSAARQGADPGAGLRHGRDRSCGRTPARPTASC